MGFSVLDYNYGENLYVTSSHSKTNYAQATDPWSEEHADYNHFDRTCTQGKMCGHYTQVVWEETTRMGCAAARCSDIKSVSWSNGGTMIICQYYPPGNWQGTFP